MIARSCICPAVFFFWNFVQDCTLHRLTLTRSQKPLNYTFGWLTQYNLLPIFFCMFFFNVESQVTSCIFVVPVVCFWCFWIASAIWMHSQWNKRWNSLKLFSNNNRIISFKFTKAKSAPFFHFDFYFFLFSLRLWFSLKCCFKRFWFGILNYVWLCFCKKTGHIRYFSDDGISPLAHISTIRILVFYIIFRFFFSGRTNHVWK